jgi:hypothetical protein
MTLQGCVATRIGTHAMALGEANTRAPLGHLGPSNLHRAGPEISSRYILVSCSSFALSLME